MKSEEQIRKVLDQYEFDRWVDKESGIDVNKYTRADLIINLLKWVLEDIEYPFD